MMGNSVEDDDDDDYDHHSYFNDEERKVLRKETMVTNDKNKKSKIEPATKTFSSLLPPSPPQRLVTNAISLRSIGKGGGNNYFYSLTR